MRYLFKVENGFEEQAKHFYFQITHSRSVNEKQDEELIGYFSMTSAHFTALNTFWASLVGHESCWFYWDTQNRTAQKTGTERNPHLRMTVDA